MVMHSGKIIETGPAADVYERPQDPYTQRLLERGAGHRHPANGRASGAATRASRRRSMAAPMAEIRMPRLSDSMSEGTIVRWLKAEGDAVSIGDELAEIESDKATVVYEAQAAGELRISAAEGATVDVGALIAWIGFSDQAKAARTDERSPVPTEPRTRFPAERQTSATHPEGRNFGRAVFGAPSCACAPGRSRNRRGQRPARADHERRCRACRTRPGPARRPDGQIHPKGAHAHRTGDRPPDGGGEDDCPGIPHLHRGHDGRGDGDAGRLRAGRR